LVAPDPIPAAQDREPPASHAEMEGLFAQLAETLDDIDFHKGRAPASAMRKLRRLFLRARPDAREVRLLRGVLADAQRMARLAGGAAGQGGNGEGGNA
jgi:tRNA (cytidine32/uridine32-2'-O)-methyltransferase